MIAIVDYGLGNIRAFVNLYERLNIPIKVAHTANDLKAASKIILPGVGAFDYAMTMLNNSGMRDELEHQVLTNRIPVIGICVGMQILAKSSEEGKLPGLGWIDGTVKKIDVSTIKYKTTIPHMGWNNICPATNAGLMKGFDNKSRFYFLHSFYLDCNNPEDTIATAEYGINFTCAVKRSNVFGIQFHPEKSHENGIRLLQNFYNI